MENLKKIGTILKSLSEENRLRIAFMLLKRPLCVCEINEILQIALSTISAHLKNMKYAGIIEDEKDGRWVVYRLANDKKVVALIEYLYKEIEDDDCISSDLRMLEKVDRYSCYCSKK